MRACLGAILLVVEVMACVIVMLFVRSLWREMR